MQRQEAVDLADRIMAEAPNISVRVEHEGAYDPESYAVQILDGITPNNITLSSPQDWERYRQGRDMGDAQWEDIEDQELAEEKEEYEREHQIDRSDRNH